MDSMWMNRLSAIGLIGFVGLLGVSSCVIHIGTGDGDWGAGGTSLGGGGTMGTGNAMGGSGGTAPTNIPAELAQLDPMEIARTNAIAGYAAVTTSNLV